MNPPILKMIRISKAVLSGQAYHYNVPGFKGEENRSFMFQEPTNKQTQFTDSK